MVNFVQQDIQQVQVFIKSGNQFLKMVRSFIAKSVREGKLPQDQGKAYFKEILHTILFFGGINRPVIEPESFFDEGEFEQLSAKYPDVFQKYNTHLPKRPPCTVLLHAVVEIIGTNVERVLNCLLDLTEEMVVELTRGRKCGNVFVSTVISYCYFWDVDDRRQKTDNYFGASVSCKGRQQRQIMIDILCCETWHKDIRLAVCIGNRDNTHAFNFRPNVHSTAYKINHRAPDNGHILRGPCERCLVMFPDIVYHPQTEGHSTAHWEYGNCAECESLSQLLYANEQIVMRQQFLISPAEQNELIALKQERLNENLRSLEFNVEHRSSYYDPSGTQ